MHDIDGTNEFEQFEAEVGEYELSQPELPLRQAQELELVSRLLEVSDEQELEGALSDVFRAVGRAVPPGVRLATWLMRRARCWAWSSKG